MFAFSRHAAFFSPDTRLQGQAEQAAGSKAGGVGAVWERERERDGVGVEGRPKACKAWHGKSIHLNFCLVRERFLGSTQELETGELPVSFSETGDTEAHR